MSFAPSRRLVAPELFKFRNGSLLFCPSTVNRFEVPGRPNEEKFPKPPWVFITVPGDVWAIALRSFPGLGTKAICSWLKFVARSALSICVGGAVTSIVVDAVLTGKAIFPFAAIPTATWILRCAGWKPAALADTE